MKLRTLSTVYAGMIFLNASLFAGGPLSTYAGRSVKWNTQNITYHLDCGRMGEFDSVTARNIAIQSFQVWQDVPTATIAFTTSTLPVDVKATNYSTYLDKYTDGINPIIFDSDGSIIEDLFGSKQGILGFAAAVDEDGDGYYDEGESVLNGYLSRYYSETEWVATFVHEFGHFIGLDHTQINGNFEQEPANTIYIPTMYPSATENDEPLAELNPDDIAAVSLLYPTAGYISSVGSISGTITYADGSPARGVNVIAIKITDSLMYQISTVSDYFWQNTGTYTISGLTPGNYYVWMEPINPQFTEGSSVGPFASDVHDISFQNPVEQEFYNGQNESYNKTTDLPNDRVIVSVSANSTTPNIDLKANGNQFASVLQYHGPLWYVFDLPSEYDETKYAVRFTPTVTTKLKAVEFYIYDKPAVNLTTDTLIISINQNVAGSLGGIPGNIVLATKKVTYASLNIDQYNYVDFSSLNIPVSENADFHVVFEIKAKAGDIISFLTDDGATLPTNRTSSDYVSPWANFLDPGNGGTGYNLAVRAYLDTTGVIVTEVEEETNIPVTSMLFQNYPNPFNPTTTITYDVSIMQRITLKIYDILGREIAILKDGIEGAGRHSIQFNGSNLTSGVYFCIFTSGDVRIAKRMVLLK